MILFGVILTLFALTVAQEIVFPLHYDITLTLNIDSLTFNTGTIITIEIENETSTVTLNAKNLDFTLVNVRNSKDEVQELTFSLDSKNENLVLNFPTPLPPTLYYVTLVSNGTIRENLEGLYLSKYSVGTEERTLLLTNFHYTKARQVFPCFDSPSFPATFSLTLLRPKSHISVASTVKISEEQINGQTVKDIFAQSDPMPPHLLSFAIIDLNQVKYEEVSVFTRNQNETEFLGQWSKTILNLFQKSEPFQFLKLDQIVVPDTALSQDVVVNLGLIIYRESAVFYSQERETLEDKQEIAKLVSTAVIKQWYKDNIGTKWSDIWVNEGITLLYHFKILDDFRPQWRLKEQFLIQELEEAFEVDYETGLSLLITNPDTFSKFFEVKAFALVRMFTHLLKPGNILEDSDNKMRMSWTKSTGFPILTVTNIGANLTFVQSSINQRDIPINVVFENEIEIDFQYDLILEDSSQTVHFSTTGSWYLVNADRFGYFRTNYGTTNWINVAHFLQSSKNDIDKITPLNRAILIQDSFNGARTGLLSWDIYLEMTKYLKRENDYIPIYSFIRTASKLKALFAKTELQNQFMQHARNLIAHLYDKIGTSLKPTESHLDTLSRIKILTWLCDFGYKQCQQEMYEILNTTTKGLHPDLQELVYCGGMRLGTVKTFMFVFDQHKVNQKSRILQSMGCTSNTDILRYYSLAIVNDSQIVYLNSQYKLTAFKAILEGSDEGVDVLLEVVKKYLEQILDSFTDEEISEMFIALSRKLVTEDQFKKVDEIFACLDDAQKVVYQKLFEDVKKNIMVNINWRKDNLEVFQNWLTANGEIDETTSSTTTTTLLPPTQSTRLSTESTKATEGTEGTPSPNGAAKLKLSFTFMMLLNCLLYFN